MDQGPNGGLVGHGIFHGSSRNLTSQLFDLGGSPKSPYYMEELIRDSTIGRKKVLLLAEHSEEMRAATQNYAKYERSKISDGRGTMTKKELKAFNKDLAKAGNGGESKVSIFRKFGRIFKSGL